MKIYKSIISLVPYVLGAAAGFFAIDSGMTREIADFFVSNSDTLEAVVETMVVPAVVLPTIYVAKVQCDYILAERKYPNQS